MRYEPELRRRLELLAPKPSGRLDFDQIAQRGSVLRRHRLLAVVAVTVVSGAISVAAVGGFMSSLGDDRSPGVLGPSGPSGPPDREAPTLARVVCNKRGAKVLTPEVAPRRDGVHIRVSNDSGAPHFYLRTVRYASDNEGGRLDPSGTTEIETSSPPGQMLIGCFERAKDIPYYETDVPEYDRLTIVDPRGLWVDPDLDCPTPYELGEFLVQQPSGEEVSAELLARAAVPGIRSTDSMRQATYPLVEFKSLGWLILTRDGRNIASVNLGFAAANDPIPVTVEACPGTGVASSGPTKERESS